MRPHSEPTINSPIHLLSQLEIVGLFDSLFGSIDQNLVYLLLQIVDKLLLNAIDDVDVNFIWHVRILDLAMHSC